MQTVMKRLFIAFVICAGFVSCQISDSSIRPVDGHQLFNYSSGLCGNYVTVPVELMEMLWLFQIMEIFHLALIEILML